MERYYGFDLGDAESAVSRLDRGSEGEPVVLPVREARSFITAYAQLESGELLIGESACYDTSAVKRALRFKSNFLTDPQAERDIRRFAAGVLGELYADGNLVKNDESCFYIGCPAGWDRAARERYRAIFEDAGYPPVRIVSESRAALISACQSRHFQVGYDIMSKPVLVVDIGSSTTDFAFILGRKEVELQTAGEVRLGGGIMDELLLEESIRRSEDPARVRRALQESSPWRSYCEFAARRLKEQYFSDEDYWQDRDCSKTVRIRTDAGARLTLRMDAEIADRLLNRGAEQLGGRSFRQAFVDSLKAVRDKIGDTMPELLFLTGGVSRLKAVREWCGAAFPEAVVITGAEPEFSVSRGLAYSGRIDAELREFRREVDDLIDSSAVERIVEQRIDELYRKVVDATVEPLLRQVAMPVFERWRSGEIARLSDIDGVMQREIEAWLHSDAAQELLVRPIAEWLKPVAYDVEEKTMPICVRHNVPYRALSLTSYFALSDIDIRIDAREVFAVEELTWLINGIISIIVGLVCGGSGLALVSSGISGIVVGAIASLLLLLLGKEKMQEMFMNVDILKPVRKLVPRAHFEARIERLTEEVKSSFYSNLENEKNAEITARMAAEISQQIEQCLSKMAEVVEIPL
ncbi:MAG: Hsp70 family protein [Clostridia bacterium]|nr:Hsp70 family protein [Clostridia bacterium]